MKTEDQTSTSAAVTVIVFLLSLNSCSNEDHATAHDAFHLKTTYNGPLESIHPRHSPDGSRISFISNKEGTWEIYTFSLPDGSPARITDDGGRKSAPGRPPDGGSVVYSLQLGQQELWQYPTR